MENYSVVNGTTIVWLDRHRADVMFMTDCLTKKFRHNIGRNPLKSVTLEPNGVITLLMNAYYRTAECCAEGSIKEVVSACSVKDNIAINWR